MAKVRNYGAETIPAENSDSPGPAAPSDQQVQSARAKPEVPAAHPSIDRGPRGWLCRELGLKDPPDAEIFLAAAYRIMDLKKELRKP